MWIVRLENPAGDSKHQHASGHMRDRAQPIDIMMIHAHESLSTKFSTAKKQTSESDDARLDGNTRRRCSSFHVDRGVSAL
jgi:hypothetical protein